MRKGPDAGGDWGGRKGTTEVKDGWMPSLTGMDMSLGKVQGVGDEQWYFYGILHSWGLKLDATGG